MSKWNTSRFVYYPIFCCHVVLDIEGRVFYTYREEKEILSIKEIKRLSSLKFELLYENQ